MPSQLSSNEKSSITDFTLCICQHSAKYFRNVFPFFSLSPFQFFSNLSSLTRKKQSRNRFRSVKINRCSKRAFQNTNEGGKRFETTGFERRERRTGRRFEPIVEWNLSGSLMNEIVHRSRSPPLRLVFIFSFFFTLLTPSILVDSCNRLSRVGDRPIAIWTTVGFPAQIPPLALPFFRFFRFQGIGTFGNGKIEHSNQK